MGAQIKEPNSPTVFVVDTHALWWYLRSPEFLTPTASTIFRLAERGSAIIIVPMIVVAELYFLSVKLRQPLPPTQLLGILDSISGIEVSQLGRSQIERLDMFPEIPDIHDRLIAAESAAFDLPLVTKDDLLSASAQIETIW